MWAEEGVEELPPTMRRLIYLATTFASFAVPCFSYGMILVGLTAIITVFVKAYNSPVLAHEAIELGKRTIRRGSSFLINGQHRLVARDSYILLNNDIDEKQNIIENIIETWCRYCFVYEWIINVTRAPMLIVSKYSFNDHICSVNDD